MIKQILLISLALIIMSALCAQSSFNYEIDLDRLEENNFYVRCRLPELSARDSVYQFVAFAPGVHQPLNYGRFVRSFRVFNENGGEIKTERKSTNEWRIEDPQSAKTIEYVIDDSYDREAEGNIIYPMSGTAFEKDFIVLNNFGIIGYFSDHRSDRVKLKLKYNSDWSVGTALYSEDGHSFEADSYFHLADSPILLGKLTKAGRMIGDIKVEVFVYSVSNEIDAGKIIDIAEPVLNSAYEFITYAPVDRYSFLMYFIPEEEMNKFTGGGALEHSYSSTYALPAIPHLLPLITSSMAHEFMHILTPLHLRSEIIANFDYSRPMSEDKHLWLYEGVTEWTAMIMPLRSGRMDLSEFGEVVSDKIIISEEIGNDWSIAKIGSEWWTPEGGKKYPNIYFLGALTASCLDIKLLRLSNGKQGLREIYLDMINKYGKNKPFDNDTFIDEFVNSTHPEIRIFFEDHILGNKPLDYGEYFGSVGYIYYPEKPSADKTPLLGLLLGEEKDHIKINDFAKGHKPFGLEKGDVIMSIFGIEGLNVNLDSILAVKNKMEPGDEYAITVRRGDRNITLSGELVPRMNYHVLEVDENPTAEKEKLRDIWRINLKYNK